MTRSQAYSVSAAGVRARGTSRLISGSWLRERPSSRGEDDHDEISSGLC